MMMRHSVVLGVAAAVALVTAKGLVSYAEAPAPKAAAVATPMLRPTDAPPAALKASASSAEISKRSDGHYWAEAEVNGRWIHCLVDTGATAVALTQADASRLGLQPSDLNYNIAVNTANGATTAAQVDLEHVSVSGARVDHVAAMVVRSGLSQSLLGMTYLGRLSRFEATPTTLILRQ